MKRKVRKINIGKDKYLVGTISQKNGTYHRVIYGPDRKCHHVYGQLAEDMTGGYWKDGYCRDATVVKRDVAKIYILTSILDKRENWQFNLTKIPNNGKLKVILENGTVKNINFNGVFEDQELVSKSYDKLEWFNPSFNEEHREFAKNNPKLDLRPFTTFKRTGSPKVKVLKKIVGYRK